MSKTVQLSVICASLALVGCGSGNNEQYDFKGDWSGTLSSNSSRCSDGSSLPADSSQVSFTIMTTGSDQIFWHAKCGDLYFTQHGNIATQSRDITCPPTTTPTSQVTQTIRDTSLVLNVNALQIDLITDFSVVTGGTAGSCNNIHSTGTLVRTGGIPRP